MYTHSLSHGTFTHMMHPHVPVHASISSHKHAHHRHKHKFICTHAHTHAQPTIILLPPALNTIQPQHGYSNLWSVPKETEQKPDGGGLGDAVGGSSPSQGPGGPGTSGMGKNHRGRGAFRLLSPASSSQAGLQGLRHGLAAQDTADTGFQSGGAQPGQAGSRPERRSPGSHAGGSPF